MSKISQKDIANSLSISRVTVTKALMDHPDIAEKTRSIVKKRALELGYIPDFIGRSLSARKTMTIGLVVPKIAHSFFSYTIEKFYGYAKEKGYHIIPMVSFEDHENEIDNIQTLLSMRVDGLIIDVAENTESIDSYELIKRAGCKLLFYDRCLVGSNDLTVTSNDFQNAFELTNLLIKKGYQNIYHFAGPNQLNIASERSRGYHEAMKGRDPKLIKVRMTPKSGYDALMKLSEIGELPDAIVSVNDSVAHGIYEAAKQLGIRIPDDLAVAGFGDLETSRLLSPPLTSVQIPVDQMTKSAIDFMIEMIEEDKQLTGQRIYKSKIIERGSI